MYECPTNSVSSIMRDLGAGGNLLAEESREEIAEMVTGIDLYVCHWRYRRRSWLKHRS